MKRYKVKDLLVPLSEYAVIAEDATIYDAVMSLEAARLQFDRSHYRHRGILVENAQHKIVGKLGQLDVLRALEPKYEEMKSEASGMVKFGFSKKFLLSMLEDFKLFDQPFDHICEKVCEEKVSKYMHRPTEGECIDEEASLDQAIHLMVLGHHQSLLVTHGDGIIGILRLTDVFTKVFNAMKDCR